MEILYRWQTLAGSFVGVIMPFLFLWYVGRYNKRKKKKEYLYYLQRIVVDQINLLVEIKDAIQNFLDLKIDTLISNIDANSSSTYSVDTAFFPLFSARPLPHDVNTVSSGSGYIDNKIAKIYALSEDFPHIIKDIRLQLRYSLEINEKIVFGGKNSPEVQKRQFKQNIIEYKKTLENDILGINIPVYSKKLAETLVAVEMKTRVRPIYWKIKFDPRWKFYIKRDNYLKDREQIMDNMDEYFRPATEKKLEKIN